MKKVEKQNTSNFWFGFALGVSTAAGIGYLLGTKDGREKLKKVLEYAEQYEGRSEDLMNALHDLTQAGRKEANEVKPNLETLIDKVKNWY